jgi:hypothetical protein
MLEFLRGKATDRKLRLFAVACCRRVRAVLDDPVLRTGVEVAERHADGLARWSELRQVWEMIPPPFFPEDDDYFDLGGQAQSELGQAVREASEKDGGSPWNVSEATARVAWCSPEDHPKYFTERRVQTHLLRDLFGPLPFRPVPIDPHVLAWNDRLVVRLAGAIYEERRWGDVPILGDAFLDAGCDDENLIAHCRSEGPHVRGCWAIDLILRKR